MYKILIFSDPHWCTSSSIVTSRGDKYSTRLNNLIESMNWVVETAQETECDEIVCCGDFFNRSDLTAEEITALGEIQWDSSIPTSFVVGNHEADTESLQYSTIDVFSDCTIFRTPTIVPLPEHGVNLCYLPYINAGGNSLSLKDYNMAGPNNIIFAHEDLAGVQYGPFKSTSGFEVEDIENNCKLFFNGHLHNKQQLGKNLYLVGNLTGQNFNEDAFKYLHGAYLLTIDEGNYKLEFIENPKALNFYKLTITSLSEVGILNQLKSNAVLSITTTPELLLTIKEKVQKAVASRIMLVHSVTTGDSEMSNLCAENHVQMFADYVKSNLEVNDIILYELQLLMQQEGEVTNES